MTSNFYSFSFLISLKAITNTPYTVMIFCLSTKSRGQQQGKNGKSFETNCIVAKKMAGYTFYHNALRCEMVQKAD
jgi:hypothetical protein